MELDNFYEICYYLSYVKELSVLVRKKFKIRMIRIYFPSFNHSDYFCYPFYKKKILFNYLNERRQEIIAKKMLRNSYVFI